jgi:hypothetical protein
VTVTVEALHEQGRQALLAGGHQRDTPPADGGRRWGVSVLVRPQPELAERLAAETAELVRLAGPQQWATGAAGSAHLTVFSLEPHRPGVGLDDPAVARYAAAVAAAAATTAPAEFDVTGLALTPGGVVAACVPADRAAHALRPGLVDAMGGDVFEATYRGDQWWLSLLHLAGPVADPGGLVAHVDGRRGTSLGRLEARSLQLVRYEYRRLADGARMVPVVLTELPLVGEV